MKANKASKQTRIDNHRKVAILGVLYFLVFLALSIFIESGEQIDFSESSCDTARAEATPPFYEKLYPWLTAHLITTPSSDQVRILYIPDDLMKVQQDLCKGRSYLGDLVNTLAAAPEADRPSAIVIDKYFSSKSVCDALVGEKMSPTEQLQSAITNARSAHIVVVVGESTTPSRIRTDDDSCLVKNADQLTFQQGSDLRKPGNSHKPKSPPDPIGLLKLNANREQIPLEWKVLESNPRSKIEQGSPTDSLSLVTATLIAPKLIEDDGFKRVLREGRQPYAQLDLNLPAAATQSLICSSKTPEVITRWRCPTYPAGEQPPILDQNKDPFKWANKVVVIGSQNEVDHWVVLGKRRWGYELQAEYIDALLSGRYLLAIPGKWAVGLWLAFILFLEGVPVFCQYLQFEVGLEVPRALQRSRTWIWIWCPAFFVLTVAVCLGLHYLPPLLLLFGILLALVTRDFINRREQYQHSIIPHEKELP